MPFFTDETYVFLDELEENNDREWFAANKARYESHVREPALALIRALAPRVTKIAPHFRADDRKIGGSLMRVHRDTRFAKDKRPYKTNVGIQLRHDGGKDVHAPGIYIHIATDQSFLGVGLWMPEAPVLDAIRTRIVAETERFAAVVEDPAFASAFSRDHHGESLKRPPRGYPADHPRIDDLKRKSHIASAPLTPEEVTSDRLDAVIVARLAPAVPYLRFLCDAAGVEV